MIRVAHTPTLRQSGLEVQTKPTAKSAVAAELGLELPDDNTVPVFISPNFQTIMSFL